MAVQHGKIIHHPGGREEEIPVLELQAEETNGDNVTNCLPTLEPLDLSDWDTQLAELQSEEDFQPLLLHELPKVVADQARTIAEQQKQIDRLMFQNKKQAEQLASLGFLQERMNEIDWSKMPENPEHPAVKARAYRKKQAILSQMKLDEQAENNSFDNVWKPFK